MSSLILRPGQKLTYSPLQNRDRGPFCSLRHFPLAPKGRGHVVVGVIWAFSVAPPEKEIPITLLSQSLFKLPFRHPVLEGLAAIDEEDRDFVAVLFPEIGIPIHINLFHLKGNL